MNRYEAELGMGRDIARRDFIHDVSLSALGLMLPAGAFGWQQDGYYPPTRTGLRGSHPGSFEVAHALAREGKTFGPAEDTAERRDARPPAFAADFPDNEIGQLATALEQALARIAAFIEREQHFTRDASYELRTPVAVIRSSAELLERQQLPDHARDQVQQIHAAALQMEQLVSTLLALAREAPVAAHSPVMLLPILEKTIVQHAHLLRDKDVQLNIQISETATVAVPAPVLSILLNNLVANAFHYTASGVIRIAWQNSTLEICDSGPGVEDHVVERLGEPLLKGRASTGFGLGLSIVKRLCDRFDVALCLGRREDGGTRAEVTFPK